MSLAGGMRELLHPPPHRGPLIAAGAVALAVGSALTFLRLLDDHRTLGIAALLASGALTYWLGAQAPNEDGEPPAYQSVLLATGLPLLAAGLFTALNGTEGPHAWAFLVTAVVIGTLAVWPALERNSAVSLLIAAILGGVALASAWNWVFASDHARPYRWLAAAYAAGLVLASLALREPARRHAEVLIDAAGLAIASIGVLGLLDEGTPAFFEVVLLGAGLGLAAFGALDRSPGPAYLGVLNLLLFIASAGQGDTLYVWPLVLLTAGVIMLGAGLRPRRPLPPEPDPYRAGEAPLAARAEKP
jgi:hypothetical protein